MAFSYSTDSSIAIRDDIPEAHRKTWDRLAHAGSWWTGAERVAIARETRNARRCGFCAERKAALSPNSVDGEHDCEGALPDAAIEAIHRLVTDAGRLTRTWFEKLMSEGLGEAPYVELVGVVVGVTSIDSFHRSLGLALEPLPSPQPGEPSRYRPASAVAEEAYVAMIPERGNTGDEADLWGSPTGNVIRAMSLVPDAVRSLHELSAVHYLPARDVANPSARMPALERPQIELLAARVSALNECFY
jgi:hypothetical protein